MELDDKTKAYEAALKRIANRMDSKDHEADWSIASRALAAFEPEPEMVYTMPEWDVFWKTNDGQFTPDGTKYVTIPYSGEKRFAYHEIHYTALRELTRVPKAKMGREFWVWDQYAHDNPKDADLWQRGYDRAERAIIHVREVIEQ